MTLALTKTLTEMSTRNMSWWVKVASAQGWQPCKLHVPNVLKSGSLNLLEHSGSVQVHNGIAFIHINVWCWSTVKYTSLMCHCVWLCTQKQLVSTVLIQKQLCIYVSHVGECCVGTWSFWVKKFATGYFYAC